MNQKPGDEILRHRTAFNPQLVLRRGDLIVRDATPWTASIHALLRHLESQRFDAPRVAGTGFDADGFETLTYIEGEVDNIAMWSLEGSWALGQLIRRLHEATASFERPPDERWFPWYGAKLGHPTVIGHRDLGPWNIVRRKGLPVAFIDWTRAGPVDPTVELAQACWLNAHLHDDVVAEAEGLPSLEERAKHLRSIVDGYGLSRKNRQGFVDLIIDIAILSAADDADQAGVRRDTVSSQAPKELVWSLSWQIRGAAWQIVNRRYLEAALLS